jgi:hypothetical protein
MASNRCDTRNLLPAGTETTRPAIAISKHAGLRMAQRNISLHDLEYVLEHGKRINRTGITIYILRRRDIRESDRRISEITRLEGTVVLTGFTKDHRLEIITIYRNKAAFRGLLCKAKYDRRIRYRTSRS